jgi:hypothetical protein
MMMSSYGEGLIQALRIIPVIVTRKAIHDTIRRSEESESPKARASFRELGDATVSNLNRARRKFHPISAIRMLPVTALFVKAELLHDG